MRVLLLLGILFSLDAHANCPDYSGTYRYENAGPYGKSWTVIYEQTGCESIREIFMPDDGMYPHSCEGATVGVPVRVSQLSCGTNVRKMGFQTNNPNSDLIVISHTLQGLMFSNIAANGVSSAILSTSTLSLTEEGDIQSTSRIYYRNGSVGIWNHLGVRQD